MKRRGLSYAKRVKDVNDIYDRYTKSGLSNREIWRRYIWPQFCISEKTFYNYLNASANPVVVEQHKLLQPTLFD